MRSVVTILQARMGSERLPGKVLAPLAGIPMLARTVLRLRQAPLVDRVVVATTTLQEDDPIQDYCRGRLNCEVFRGSAENVLERYALCAREVGADIVVRATGDNPAIDPVVVGEAVSSFIADGNLDYLYFREGLPIGMCVEVFSAAALERAYQEAQDGDCLEHVTPYIRLNPLLFNVRIASCSGIDYSSIRLTVDTFEDLQTMRMLYTALSDRERFGWRDAVAYIEQNPKCVFNSGIAQKTISYKGSGGSYGC